MDSPYRAVTDERIDDALACLDAVEGSVVSAVSALGLDDLIEVAEHVEQLARRVYRLQVQLAGAVEAASPARSRSEGSRNAPFRRGCDLLRSRCRITRAEAQRRINTAEVLLGAMTLTGQPLPPRHEYLARLFDSASDGLDASEDTAGSAAGDGCTHSVSDDDAPDEPCTACHEGASAHDGASSHDGESSGRSTTGGVGAESVGVVLRVLREAAKIASREDLIEADRLMSRYAATFDPDMLTKVGKVLLAHLDPDGAEPSESDLATRQGVRIGSTWRGLTKVEIWADCLQLETLMTVFDTGTNPRTNTGSATGADANPSTPTGSDAEASGVESVARGGASAPPPGTVGAETLVPEDLGDSPAGVPDIRTRAQRMLDALVAACQAALRSATLPAVGGLLPQIVVTMDANDLTEQLLRLTATPVTTTTSVPSATTTSVTPATTITSATPATTNPDPPCPARPGGSPPGVGVGWLPHQAPVPVSRIRHLACEASIIPALLGSDGDVIDLGRAQRLVSPAMRKALIARDGGCLTPGCTIPATWTEAHHVNPWSNGGTTSIANSVLLCAYHHHQVHAGRLVIRRASGEELIEPTTLLTVRGPYRVTTPWQALSDMNHNPYYQAS